ncbi:flagellar hook-length control protein FliK [Desulfovibrio sp. OttesenSCG-928-A18]|nr:flagellar hook-length control protein FliK [Desulfovibrio sp. OttesenSCG-928-A18]
MQFFPVAANAMVGAIEQNGSEIIKDVGEKASEAFAGIYSSFIEEGRLSYCGRPAGFSSYGTVSGTLGGEEGKLLKKALEKRNVSEFCTDALDQLLASGQPMTVGSLLNGLGGNQRLSEALLGDERDAFKMLLGKLGFSKDEVEEMLGMSDDGDINGMWKLLSGGIGRLDGKADVSRGEFEALLSGLDLSPRAKNALMQAFGESDSLSLDAAELESLLAGVSKEYASREEANRQASLHMRDAVVETLQKLRQQEQAAPVDDMRGSRRSEQSEALMQNSVLNKTGADNILNAARENDATGRDGARHGQDLNDEGSPHEGREGPEGRKSRARSILETAKRDETAPAAASAADSGATRLIERIDLATGSARVELAPLLPQNLDSLASSHRQEIFSQVEHGILQNWQNGSQRLTLQLNPSDLGQVTVILSVHQGELKASIRADQPESAAVLREQMAELKSALEAEGIKVKEIEVQTGPRDSELNRQFAESGEHNFMRDTQERDRMQRLGRIRREAVMAERTDSAAPAGAAFSEDAGLHIVA